MTLPSGIAKAQVTKERTGGELPHRSWWKTAKEKITEKEKSEIKIHRGKRRIY